MRLVMDSSLVASRIPQEHGARNDGRRFAWDPLQAITRPEPAWRKEKKIFSNESFISSTSTLNAHDVGDLEACELPTKVHGRLHRNIRYTFLSVYHRLNILVVTTNLLGILLLWGFGKLFNLDAQSLGTAAAGNLLAAVLIRQELVINLMFAIFGKLPHWIPLRVRRLAAKIYHLGGVHSGAGIAATVWFGFLNVPIVEAWKKSDFRTSKTALALLITTAILDVLLISIVLFSHPSVRTKFHNPWEIMHRFAGWTAVGLFWGHVLLSASSRTSSKSPKMSTAHILSRNPIFWCLFVVTIALVLPWIRLRKVPVRAEHLSRHAIRLHFGYTNLPLCAAPRFTDSPLKEWHAFAGIPEQDGAGFSILMSRAGDWTSKIIDSPPKELWIKGTSVRGVLHVAPIFKKLVLVATGSGIGPILSLLHARNLNARIIWSTPDPILTYHSSILEQIRSADPDAVIINTSKQGRPDLIRETYKVFQAYQAEAVFIISNPKVTRKVVYGLESRGIPIFAPIFDS